MKIGCLRANTYREPPPRWREPYCWARWVVPCWATGLSPEAVVDHTIPFALSVCLQRADLVARRSQCSMPSQYNGLSAVDEYVCSYIKEVRWSGDRIALAATGLAASSFPLANSRAQAKRAAGDPLFPAKKPQVQSIRYEVVLDDSPRSSCERQVFQRHGPNADRCDIISDTKISKRKAHPSILPFTSNASSLGPSPLQDLTSTGTFSLVPNSSTLVTVWDITVQQYLSIARLCSAV